MPASKLLRVQTLVVKDHKQGLGAQQVVVVFAHGVAAFEVNRHVEDGFDLFLAPFEQGDKIFAFEAVGSHVGLLLNIY